MATPADATGADGEAEGKFFEVMVGEVMFTRRFREEYKRRTQDNKHLWRLDSDYLADPVAVQLLKDLGTEGSFVWSNKHLRLFQVPIELKDFYDIVEHDVMYEVRIDFETYMHHLEALCTEEALDDTVKLAKLIHAIKVATVPFKRVKVAEVGPLAGEIPFVKEVLEWFEKK